MLMRSLSIGTISLLALGAAGSALAQVNTGEFRLTVTDPAGLGLKALVIISSEASQYRNAFTTSDAGEVDVKALAYGIYLVRVEKPGFAESTEPVEVRSALPTERTIQLAVAPVKTSVQVSSAPLIDPNRPSSIMQIGSQQIQDRVASLPGRSVQDLVNSQPGWLYEGNAVLHPRGSEYQTQFVVDGIPLTDNRSPSFGPEIEADDVDSVSIYTAGIPAEYGRKMGGVVEVNTRRETAARPARTGGPLRRQLRHSLLLRSDAVRMGQEYLRRQRLGQHDRPLSQSRSPGELHQPRDDAAISPSITNAIYRTATGWISSVRHELSRLRDSQ